MPTFSDLFPTNSQHFRRLPSASTTRLFWRSAMQAFSFCSGRFGRPNLPEQKENACMADRQNSLVVDADGSLLKCWEFVGNKSEKVGILEEGWRVDEKGIYGLSHDPFSHELCKQCKVLPLCMGWCPIRVRCLPTKDSCNVIRFNLKKKLLHYYLTQQKQKGGAYGVQSSSPFAGDQSV